MSDCATKIGVDRRGDHYYIARVCYTTGRPEITTLARVESALIAGHALLQGGDIIISVPDRDVTVKRLGLKSVAEDFIARAKFELIQSMLEDAEKFSMDVIPVGEEGRFLGLIMRRDDLSRAVSRLTGNASAQLPEASYLMKAAALAAGYLSFCNPQGGDLVCAADFDSSVASIAFIYRSKLIDLTCISVEQSCLATSEGLCRLAVELKTLINFRLASFASNGVSLPLSALVISGDGIDNNAISTLKKHFSCDILTPQINPGFITDAVHGTEVSSEKYLVALGLAAN